jgi:hypothetical protein
VCFDGKIWNIRHKSSDHFLAFPHELSISIWISWRVKDQRKVFSKPWISYQLLGVSHDCCVLKNAPVHLLEKMASSWCSSSTYKLW